MTLISFNFIFFVSSNRIRLPYGPKQIFILFDFYLCFAFRKKNNQILGEKKTLYDKYKVTKTNLALLLLLLTLFSSMFSAHYFKSGGKLF